MENLFWVLVALIVFLVVHALSLFGSLIGLTFINLLSHAWTDDTLAYVWWGLAGIAMAPLPEIKDVLKNGKT